MPAVFHALLAAIERRGADLHARRCASASAAARRCPVELQDRWFDVTGVELRQGYGLTEAGPVCLFNRVDRPNVRGTLGVPFPGVDVDLRCTHRVRRRRDARDASDATRCAMATRGEICVRGDNVFRGYVSDGAAGLPRSRRLAAHRRSRRPQRRRHDPLRGLLKPMFTRNGFNIYPREIERVVREMPGVAGARGRGRSAEPTIGNRTSRSSVTGSVTEDEVRAWCASRLSAYKQPTSVRVL